MGNSTQIAPLQALSDYSETMTLREEIASSSMFEEIVGASATLDRLIKKQARAAADSLPAPRGARHWSTA